MMMNSRRVTIYAGKILNLMCVTTGQEVYGPPDESKWAINGSEIDFSLHRGGINIQSTKRRLSSTFKLTILNIQHKDSGLYECRNIWHQKRIPGVTKVYLFFLNFKKLFRFVCNVLIFENALYNF